MNEQQSALAYARAYELFSQIYQHGVVDEQLALLGLDSNLNGSHFGAEHYQLFVHNVFPYESIFLGDDGLLGGSITEQVVTFYGHIGFDPTSDDSADHISNELNAMAHLCYAESDALEDQITHQSQRIRQLERRFLDEHLLRWMPLFTIAVRQQENSIYTEIVEQSLDLVCAHRAYLGDNLMATDNPFALATSPELIASEKTSLRDIARYLLTPAYTGFFLSSDDIKRIGAHFRIPHGFGKRQQILTNLLRTASDYDVFPDVIATFRQIVEGWQQQLNAMTTLPDAITQVWIERQQAMMTVLTQIEELAQHHNLTTDNLA